MTNPNPINPKSIMTENMIRERLDVIQSEFAGSSNPVQAKLDEEKLIQDFLRALTVKGGVRKIQDCALALVEKCHFVTL